MKLLFLCPEVVHCVFKRVQRGTQDLLGEEKKRKSERNLLKKAKSPGITLPYSECSLTIPAYVTFVIHFTHTEHKRVRMCHSALLLSEVFIFNHCLHIIHQEVKGVNYRITRAPETCSYYVFTRRTRRLPGEMLNATFKRHLIKKKKRMLFVLAHHCMCCSRPIISIAVGIIS